MNYDNIEGATFVRLEKGDYIIRSDDYADHYYIVLSGTCHRAKCSDKGDEIIVSTYGKHHIVCAFMAYYNLIANSDIIADDTLCCWRIPREAFNEVIDQDPALMKILLDQIMREHMDLMIKFRSKQEGRTPNLLCQFIVTHAIKNAQGGLYLDKAYSNVKIARHLGVHKVTATRIINRLQKEGIVARTPEGLSILDHPRLLRYANKQEKLTY